MTNEKIVTVFKAFSDESRVKILGLLKEGEMCGNAILEQMQIGQSTLSHHMKLLVESGIVTGRKDGKWTYYSINKAGGEVAKQMLEEIMDAKDVKAEPQPGSAKPAKAAPKRKAAPKKKAEPKPVEAPAAEEVKPAPAPEPVIQEPKKEAPVRRRQMDTFLL